MAGELIEKSSSRGGATVLWPVQGGDVVGAAQAVTSTMSIAQWTVALDGGFGEMTDLHLQARRTSGAGSIRAQVFGSAGRQS